MKELGKKFPNIYISEKRRKSLYVRGKDTYFEETGVRKGKVVFREFDHTRSKLAAAIMKKISQIGFRQEDIVLYLGASHGYTPSFVSDIVGKQGFVFAVDHAPRVMRDLVFLCEKKENMCPVLADANNVDELAKHVCQADIVYQDLAQRNQTDIFLKNCKVFLKKEGFGILCLKARSVDVTKKPKQIFKQVRLELEKHMTVVDYRELDPYEKDHAFFVCKKR